MHPNTPNIPKKKPLIDLDRPYLDSKGLDLEGFHPLFNYRFFVGEYPRFSPQSG